MSFDFTYSTNGATMGQLSSTYRWACNFWICVKVIIEEDPTSLPICGKIEDTKEVLIGSSQTRLGLLNLVSTSSIYREQKVRDSSAK